MSFNLSGLDNESLFRRIKDLEKQVQELERVVKSLPISSKRIDSLTADKLTTGTLEGTIIDVGNSEGGLGRIRINGEENRIEVRDENGDDIILLGRQVEGF